MSTYDFSTLHTTLSKIKSLYWLVMRNTPFVLLLNSYKDMKCGNVEVSNFLHYLLNNLYTRFSSKLYIQVIGVPMGTNCALLFANLGFLFYERDLLLSYERDLVF